MGYQFCRIQLFSRKGKKGRNTEFILDEVSRVPSACLHVTKPDRPNIVFGIDIPTLRKRHDDQAAAARTVTLAGKSRAIRSDQNTLVGIVLSHPATVEDYHASADDRRDVNMWERRSIDWLKNQFGDQLITVVRHLDESHPHLHAYILPADSEMKAANLHPGFAAKNEIMSSTPMAGEGGKAQKKRADHAYVQAMRSWLDDYHQQVAVPSGLSRLGPGKRRLTREEWQREKLQAAALKATLKRAKTVEARVTKIVHDARDAALVSRQEAVEAENLQKRH
ncbi:plasmid recombination protein [Hoeflea ulvae]|uniref:Plasmid recombination protein n=1 Tax=Hoeflea ulvae TaxID=2983764 RepID=A0ABT3YD97_9HYPH|nr:plasmid recombination protein [Hoeflea ulvae]MCY0093863.1 plasmid recombination protein [Hoeflea ulvae]